MGPITSHAEVPVGRSRAISASVLTLSVLLLCALSPTAVSALGSRDVASPQEGTPKTAALPSGEATGIIPTEITSAVKAGQEIVLDPDAAVALAEKANLQLAKTAMDTDLKRKKYNLAWNAFVPTVDVSGTLGRLNDESEGYYVYPYPMNGTGFYSSVYAYHYAVRWTASASISAQLVLNAALFEGVESLRKDYESGALSYQQAKAQLQRDVRKGYLSLLLLQENLKLMEEQIASAERRVKQAEANYRAALVPELTVLQAKVAAANLRPALEELRNGYEASLAGFAMNLGLQRGTRITLKEIQPASPSETTLDADKLIGEATGSRLDLALLRSTISKLESARKATFYQLYTPSLVLGWTADPTLSNPWDNSWLDSDNWSQRSGLFRATVSFRLNGLLPQSKEAQGLVEMDDNIGALRLSLAMASRGMEMEIDSLVMKLEKSRRSLEPLSLNVELAEKAYRLAEDAYNAGAKDLLDVQNAELELRKAKLEVLKERFNYATGLLDLEYAVGAEAGSLSRSE